MGVIRGQGIKNTIIIYFGVFLGFISLIIIQPRLLTKEELGLTRLLYTFSILAAYFVPLGVNNITQRYFPYFNDKAQRHYGFLGFILLFLVVGYILTSVFLYLSKDFIKHQYQHESPYFLEFFTYIFPLVFFISAGNILTAYCYINYKTTIPSFLNDIVIRIFIIILMSIYYLRLITFNRFIDFFVLLYGIQALFLIAYILVFDKPSLRISWKYFHETHFTKMVKYGMILWLSSLACMGLKYFDTLLIGKYMQLSFVGIYAIAAIIPNVIEAPLNAFDKVASSRIAFAFAEKRFSDINEIYNKSATYMLLIGGWFFLMININLENIFSFLPPGYSEGHWVVLIISIASLFNMSTGFNNSIIMNSDKYRYGAMLSILLVLFMLGLQMYLIPRFGMEGAAFATALSVISYNAALCFIIKKHYQLNPFNSRSFMIIILILVCFFSCLILPFLFNHYFDLILRSVTISTLYLIGIYLFNLAPEYFNNLLSIRANFSVILRNQ